MQYFHNKKSTCKGIAVIAFVVVCLLLMHNGKAVTEYADRHILLEYTNSGLYHLEQSRQEKRILQTIAEHGTVNLVRNVLQTGNYEQGFTITVNEDGSFTYSGTNHAEYNIYITIGADCFNNTSGDFIISDTKSAGDPELSQDGIYVYLQGQVYDIGGETEYPVTYDLRSGTQKVTIGAEDSSVYYFNVCISPGFTSEGITFYPMITRSDQASSTFQPCVISDSGAIASPSVSYDDYIFSKRAFLQLTESDLKKLDRAFRYQFNAKWMTIDFQDGTGLVYTRGDGSNKANTDPPVYGELDGTGRISVPLGGMQEIAAEVRPLQKITYFADYLRALNNRDYSILIAVRDDGFTALVGRDNTDLQALGVQTEISPYNYRHSYYAVLHPGRAAREELSEQALTCTGTLEDGTRFEINSSGFDAGNLASIRLNGQEWSMNRRGMNFVVYDNTLHRVVDTVCFDTCSGLSAYRPPSLPEEEGKGE